MGLEDTLTSVAAGTAFKNPYGSATSAVASMIPDVSSLSFPTSVPSGVDPTEWATGLSSLTEKLTDSENGLLQVATNMTGTIDSFAAGKADFMASGKLNAAVGCSNVLDNVKALDGAAAQATDGCWPASVATIMKGVDPDTIAETALVLAGVAGGLAILDNLSGLDSLAALNEMISQVDDLKANIDAQISKFEALQSAADSEFQNLTKFAQAFCMDALIKADPCAAKMASILMDGY